MTSRLVAATASHLASRIKYAVVVSILYIIYIFNIKGEQNPANDISYTPKSKRTWMTKLIARLDNNFNKVINRIYNITKEWPSHKIKCKYNNTKVKQSLHHNKYRANRPCRRMAKVLALTTIVVNDASIKATARIAPGWDDNSNLVGIDNRCSGCISHRSSDFVGNLTDCHRNIKGFGGTRHFNVKMGTLRWHWEDEEGKIHKFLIPKSYYIPEGKVRLLSPNIGLNPKKILSLSMIQNPLQIMKL